MKNETNKMDIWVISNVSAFLGQGIDTQMGDSVYWYLDNGSQLEIDSNEKEIKFIDWVGDTKTYFAIVGLASSYNFTTNDYFTEKN
jgi:capsid portal protein